MAFKQESQLKSHIKLKHFDEDPIKCDFPGCFYGAKTSSNLKQHLKLHSNEKPFACPHSGCHFRTKRKDHLPSHIANVHSDSRTMTCAQCSYSTNYARNLESHMVVHEGKFENIPCSIDGCEYKGKNSAAFKAHMRRHKTRLPCPVSGCRQYVITKEALKNHLKLHNPLGRAFRCPLCHKNYQTLHDLQRHCFVHTNEKPFHCGHCKYEAAARARVEGHISSVHAGIEFPLIVHLLDDRECLRCNEILPNAEFVSHCNSHVEPVLITKNFR